MGQKTLCPTGCGVEIDKKTILRHHEKKCLSCEFCGQKEATVKKRIAHEKMCKIASVEEKKEYVKEIKRSEKKKEAVRAAEKAKPEIRWKLRKRTIYR